MKSRIKLLRGDALRLLKNESPNSVDSLVTDPPAGISFMGKAWDHGHGGTDNWIFFMRAIFKECFRVLKPGAHGLVWALPRTSHRTALSLERAGFEIRDVITHVFGSGFPKSLDVSKAIDKAAGRKPRILGRRSYTAPNIKGDNYNRARAGRETVAITAPTTRAAKRWQGFGTALKPAAERWVLIKKPYLSPEIDREICYSNALIGALLCRLSSAKFAGLVSTLNQQEQIAETSASAQWLVAAFNTLRSIEPSDLMDMFPSPEAASTFLNIASLWSDTLDALLRSSSKSIIGMASDLITDLRTLNSCLLKITHESIIPVPSQKNTQRSNADIVGSCLSEIKKLLSEIRTRSVHASAIATADLSLGSIRRLRGREYALPTGPLSEDFILIRKPLSESTVAKNVLKWGCGALNVDGSRIGGQNTQRTQRGACGFKGDVSGTVATGSPQGRFPANFVLSCCGNDPHEWDCPVGMLDRQSGVLGNAWRPRRDRRKRVTPGIFGGDKLGATYPDSGTASRFFYVAKPSRRERNQGCEGMDKRAVRRHGDRAPDVGRKPQVALMEGNAHPTVKPLTLMRYLIRLVTPPKGLVLDPFLGSGTTGVAARMEGFRFIGIEKEKDYLKIARNRIAYQERKAA